MKKTYASIMLLAALGATSTRADFNPVPLTPSSFTADVVVEATAPKPLPDYTTVTLNGGTNNLSSTWFETGLDSSRPNTGLPSPGTTIIAESDPNRTYRMPPTYTGPNAFFVTASGVPTATINFSTPAAASALSLFGSGAGNDTTLNYTVNFQGGASETGTVFVQDWFNRTTTIAKIVNGRINLDSGQIEELYSNNPRLHYADIYLADTTTPVVSIQLTSTSTGTRVGIFGVSTSTDNVNYTPATVTGFNHDLVVENTAPMSSLFTKCNVIMDSGATNLNNQTWYEMGFNKNAPATGLPAAGSTISGGSPFMSFTMPPTYTTNNCIYIGNYAGYTTGTLTLSTPANYGSLSFLSAAGNGPVSINVTVYHADSSTEFFTFNSLDWFNQANPFYTTAGRFHVVNLGLNDVNSTNPRLYTNSVVLANTASPVTSIQFDYASGGGRSSIFAVAGQPVGGGNFNPVIVTGYTADPVVEASAFRFPSAYYGATTATMDGGTNFTGGNNNLNTWYERGYYRNRPETGLPPAGSTITSITLPDHHYQMPASYTGNNAIFVDSTFTNANLTPLTPATYSALSFLSTCANGTVTNQVVMQYQDGTSETNTFISRDWFNNTPYAFTSRGRTDVNRQTVNNVGSDNPRLYEAQFALANTGSPITNMILSFLGGSSANSRMFVFAVSGSAGDVPPIISSISITPGSTYEGSNVVLNAVITGGTPPISYQWQKGTNGVYVNLNNGGNITGATTTNMVIAATINDLADYRLIASNVAGTVPSGIATLQRVLSNLPDVTIPGDQITLFAGTTPGAEGAGQAINNTTDKYLNFDSLDNAAPFVGPVGFVVKPSIGNTILNALRFYTANDSEGRDPADYVLEGSQDGVTFSPIASGALSLPTGRNAAALALAPLTQNVGEVRFANSAGYSYYRLTFNNVRDNNNANSMQIGEIEFLGVLNPNPPPTFSIVPTDVAANEGTTATFTSLAVGAAPITYQWYNVTSGDPGVAIGGATGPNLSLPAVTLAQSGSSYRVVASNPYGSATSPVTVLPGATLTVNSGAPFVTQDLPAETVAYAGRNHSLAVVVSGTNPSYQWQSNGVNMVNGGRISGATSNVLTIANIQPGDAATYQLQSQNIYGGPVPSSPTALAVTVAPTFQNNGTGWAFTNQGGGGAFFVADNVLSLTTAGDQRRALWFTTKMNITAFKTTFVYQDIGGGGADGMAFVVQNSTAGVDAIGGGGGGLAYSGITPSAAVTFNIFGTPGVAFNTNGNTGGYATTGPVDIAGGDPIHVTVSYAGTVLTLTLSNTVSAATFTTNYTVGNLATLLGSDLAYIGITAATGGIASNQQVSDFRYVPIPSVNVSAAGSNLLLTWPASIGGYVPQSSPSLTTPVWSTISGLVNQTNNLHHRVVTPGSTPTYYKLVLPLP